MQESIYSIRRGDISFFSNSIAFLLAETGYELDPNYLNYEEDFNSIYFGVNKCVNQILLRNGEMLKMHRLCNLIIDSDFNLHKEKRKSGLHFNNFDDYYGKLLDVMEKIKNNSQSSDRLSQYGMVTTISRGYDAPCASVVAHEIGCDVAVTLGTPIKYINDKGTEIAQQLGFSSIIEGDGDVYRNNSELWEAENSASGATGCQVQFNVFEKYYHDCLLFVGVRGDSLWNKNAIGVNNDMDYLYLETDADLNFEHYYRTNTIVINLPMFGADVWSEIHRISNSEEMKPWCTNNDYDRPIPRRIIESKGIARHAFGYKKMGAGFSLHFETLYSLRKKMSPTSYESLLKYKKTLKRNKLKYCSYVIKYYLSHYRIYVNYIMNRLRIPRLFKSGSTKYMSSPISSLLILWGMNEMVKRYKKAL